MELAELHPNFRAIHLACVADDEKAWQARQLVVVEEKMGRGDVQYTTIFQPYTSLRSVSQPSG
jgi:hypothetical protein